MSMLKLYINLVVLQESSVAGHSLWKGMPRLCLIKERTLEHFDESMNISTSGAALLMHPDILPLQNNLSTVNSSGPRAARITLNTCVHVSACTVSEF